MATDRRSESKTVPHQQDGARRDVQAEGTNHSQALAAAKLEEARQASRQGDRERAYQLSREATHLAPENPDGWLYRAAFASTYVQQLDSLNRALSLSPGDP